MRDLSIIIPARNEIYLKRTVEDILSNIEADTDIIVGLDGQWAFPSLNQNERVNIVYSNVVLGQRGITNLACKLSDAKYVMKVDAHCSFDKGFDRKMIERYEKTNEEAVYVPIMHNLHVFDWVCKKCGNRWYQGRTPTSCRSDNKGKETNEKCDSKEFEKVMVWEAKRNPKSKSYCFDSEPHFQYFNSYKNRKEYRDMLKKDRVTETMSLQGSAFFSTRELYWKLKLCDESLGSWGNQGIEVACKMWLSGRRVLVNHDTWYAHLFRTQGGDFGFPYDRSEKEVQITKKKVKDLFWNFKWEYQKYPVSWLVDRFKPVKGWSDEDIKNLRL